MSQRPKECLNCQKPIKVVYKEIAKNTIVETEMCGECPIFDQKYQGSCQRAAQELICPNCQTSISDFRHDHQFGCPACYDLFKEELDGAQHIGKQPGVCQESLPRAEKLSELTERLNAALKEERYEEAARLRDQIKELMDQPNE